MSEGVEGLLHDRSRPSGIAPTAPEWNKEGLALTPPASPIPVRE